MTGCKKGVAVKSNPNGPTGNREKGSETKVEARRRLSVWARPFFSFVVIVVVDDVGFDDDVTLLCICMFVYIPDSLTLTLRFGLLLLFCVCCCQASLSGPMVDQETLTPPHLLPFFFLAHSPTFGNDADG